MVRRTLAVLATAIAVTLLLAFHAMDVVELPARDAMLRLLPRRPATATAIVAIDEASLQKFGPFPWDRPRLASVVDAIADAGARAIVIDIVLADARPGDDILAAAMGRRPTLAVVGIDDRGEWRLPAGHLRAAVTPVHGNFELDRDGILRRFAATKQSSDSAFVALSLRAASIVTGAPIPVGRSIAPEFRTRPNAIPVVSAASINRDPILRDKIVFLGPTALALGDRVMTPVAPVPYPGVMVHAAATESIIRGETVRELPPIVSGLLAGAVVAFPWLFAIIIIAAIALLPAAGIAVPVVTLLAVVIITMAIVTLRHMRAHIARESESKRVLAHELRTPLASMRNLSQLLAEFELTEPERRRAASLIESEAGKLQSMVDVLLDLERLPMRDFARASSVIDVGDLVRARVEFLKASTDRDINVNAPSGIFARADAALLERVVDNLTGNAIKYTPADSPISISVDRGARDVVIAVEDRGPGISEAERVRIFDRFFRGSSAAGTQGLGLGLSLVAEVARWHGGNVRVESGPRGGSRFSFSIPAIAAAAAGSM